MAAATSVKESNLDTSERSRVKIALIALVVAAAVAGCATARSSARIELSAVEFDFGTIPNTKPVSQTFQVRNVGRGTLEIGGMSTSCGCTTAEVSDRQLAPGEETSLKVTYDPQVHNGETGEFLRIVYVRSDDPEMPEVTLTIRVKVTEP